MSKSFVGTVSSNSADKTIVVSVKVRKTHPIYKKQYIVTTKYMAHDEDNSCQVGDKVMISECKPLSARKHFKLAKVLDKTELAQADKEILSGDDTATDGKEAECCLLY